jgi:anti-sigma28 factor (negative regulator of flagellin synthesis)
MKRHQDEQGLIRTGRSAAPATAREILKANTESLGTTDASSSAAASAPALEPRLAMLRASIQDGSYQVDIKIVTHKLLQDHLEGRER